MTHILDYSVLFDHDQPPHLSLSYDPAHPTMRWAMLDCVTGQLFARASTLKQAASFMREAARRGDVSLDLASIEFHEALASEDAWARAQAVTYSVKVPDEPTNVIPLPVRGA